MLAEGDLLTIAQVQKLVPLARSTIYALVASGELPSFRVRAAGGGRGRVLVSRRDLEAFIERARDTRPVPPVRVDADALLKKVRRG